MNELIKEVIKILEDIDASINPGGRLSRINNSLEKLQEFIVQEEIKINNFVKKTNLTDRFLQRPDTLDELDNLSGIPFEFVSNYPVINIENYIDLEKFEEEQSRPFILENEKQLHCLDLVDDVPEYFIFELGSKKYFVDTQGHRYMKYICRINSESVNIFEILEEMFDLDY